MYNLYVFRDLSKLTTCECSYCFTAATTTTTTTTTAAAGGINRSNSSNGSNSKGNLI
jgi:hypothetical protein